MNKYIGLMKLKFSIQFKKINMQHLYKNNKKVKFILKDNN